MLEAGLVANAAREELWWKYWLERTDWPGPRSFVLSRGSEILAHAALIPGVYASGTRRFRVIHLIDWAARATSSGAGAALMKSVRRLTDAMLALGGSQQTLQILPQLGFRPCGAATVYVRTLRPSRILVPSVHSTWRLAPRLVRSALWTMTAPAPRVPGWQTRLLRSEDVGVVNSVLPGPRRDLAILERSEALLRYSLACPIAPMQLYSMAQDGRVRGYFLLAFALGQARLADCWIDSEDAADWCALVQCAVARAKENSRVAELVAWASDSTLSNSLRNCGFHARGTVAAQLLAAPEFDFVGATPRLQMLDNDGAYRHLGRNEFLA